MPDKAAVRKIVVATLSGFTQLNTSLIKNGHVLRDAPLSLDSNQLAFVAMSLRGYVQYHSGKAKTVLAKETRKSG